METPMQIRTGRILSALPVLFLLFDSAIKLVVIQPVVDLLWVGLLLRETRLRELLPLRA
jgi:hypothetical protein